MTAIKNKTCLLFFVLSLLVILIAGCVQPEYSADSASGSTTPSLQPSPIPTLKNTPTPVPVITPTPLSALPSSPPLKFRVDPLKPFFMPGEEVEVAITFENAGNEPITLSPYPPEIKLIAEDPYRVVHVFKSGDGELKLMPGENSTYLLKWNNSLSPGFYNVEIGSIRVYGLNNSWIVSTSLGKILIQYPQGAMERVIEINQTQTVNDVTVALKRVELTPVGWEVQVLARLPISPQTPNQSFPLPEPTPPPGKYSAVYRIDGSEKRAYSPGLKWVDGNLRITWQIDPIPADAKEMIFIITELSQWRGPWEFHISLEK